MRRFATGLALAVLVAALPAWGLEPVPHKLDFQGVLRNLAGEPVTGTYNVTFRLHDAPMGGTLLYQEMQTLAVTGGVFSALVGAVPASAFLNRTDVYLGVQLGTEPELPRLPLSAVAFAIQAEHCEQADELLGAATDLQCASACVAASEVSFNYANSATKGGAAMDLACTGCVGTTDIGAGSITDTLVASGISGSKVTAATTTSLGVVQVGTGLTISSGLLTPAFGTTADSVAMGNHAHSKYYENSSAANDLIVAAGKRLVLAEGPIDFAISPYLTQGTADGDAATRVSVNFPTGGTAAALEIRSDSPALQAHVFRADGNATHAGDVTARVFRDADDNLFYLDPNGTSRLKHLNVATNNSWLGYSANNANYLRGVTYAFNQPWYDEDDTAYYLDPASTSRVKLLYSGGLRLDNNWPGDPVGFAQIANNGGHLFLGPDSQASQYVVLRYGASNRIQFLLSGGSDITVPSIRTNGSYLAINPGSGDRNLYLLYDTGGTVTVNGALSVSGTVTLSTKMVPTAHNTGRIGLTAAQNDGTNPLFFESFAAIIYSSVSGSAFKRDLRDLGVDGRLEALEALRMVRSVRFFYLEEGTAARPRTEPHIGFTAESLPPAVWAGGNDPTAYSLTDMDGLLLASIQALDAENRALHGRVLQAEWQAQELEARLRAVEAALAGRR